MQEILMKYTDKYAELIIPWLLTSGLKIVFIVIGSLILNKVIITFIEKAVRIAVRPDGISSKDAEEKRENTLIQIFTTTSKIGLMTIAGLMVLQEFGVEIAPILAAAGIVGLAFGFGGQYLIRDIISGLFIILENQYRVGDIVNFDNAGGTVEEISLRKTTLRDLDGTVHHVPHGEIKKVSNLSKDFSRINLDMGVGYSSNLEHVITVINKVGNEIATDPLWKDAIILAPQFLRVNDFADSSIMLKILGETLPSRQWEVTGELRKRLKVAFDKEGIEIPFPQVVMHRPKSIEETTVKNDANEIQKS
ncbi:small conductance mechanosensitive channel [Flavobacterium gillisiae]|uniref:Small conductance mechanosensitive channel n=1 Tax=Flavobacterium gillisiae TaxID=150146 RepID=A0A1H4DXY5_9FLAO|nr:mechanosensitive ion channel family protein [Flavobacterium gillisiae]SEA77447.1 small conductance mechanosensitive channel [Flavobacterium gillisiae]